MKRTWIFRIVGVFIVLAIGTSIYLELQWQPRISEVTEAFVIDNGMQYSYSYHHHDPFRDGLVWITPHEPRRTAFRHFLFDLEESKITHVMEKSDPVLINRNYKSTLGISFGSLRLFLRWKFQIWMNIPEEGFNEVYFALDLFNHEKCDKSFLQIIDSIIEYSYLSPDGRFALFNVMQGKQFILDYLDLSITELPTSAKSWEGGWLSNHECFYRDSVLNVVVYDVRTQESTVILTPSQLATFLAQHDLQINQNVLFTVRSVPEQNGDRMIINGNEYLDWKSNKLNEDEAWVVEIDRENKELKFLHDQFPYSYLGKWNSELTKYVFPGERDSNDSGTIYVYHVKSDVIESIESGIGFSIPNYYGDQIIYANQNAMWIMNDDGTGKRQLFPPVN